MGGVHALRNKENGTLTGTRKTQPRSAAKKDENLLDSEVIELQEAQRQHEELQSTNQIGALDANKVLGGQVVLAARNQPGYTPPFKVSGPSSPGDSPIAVVSADGSVYPFSGEIRDREALLGYNVTYVYHREDVKALIAHNEKMHRDGNVDRVIMGVKAAPVPGRTAKEARELKESIAVAFDPAMLQG